MDIIKTFNYNLSNLTPDNSISERIKRHAGDLRLNMIQIYKHNNIVDVLGERICSNIFGGGNLNAQVRNHPFVDLVVNKNDNITQDDELISVKTTISKNEQSLSSSLSNTKAISIDHCFKYLTFCLSDFMDPKSNFDPIIKKILSYERNENVLRYNFLKLIENILDENEKDKYSGLIENLDDININIDEFENTIFNKLNDIDQINDIYLSIASVVFKHDGINYREKFKEGEFKSFNFKIVVYKSQSEPFLMYFKKMIGITSDYFSKSDKTTPALQNKDVLGNWKFYEFVIETGEIDPNIKIDKKFLSDKNKVASHVMRSYYGDDKENHDKSLNIIKKTTNIVSKAARDNDTNILNNFNNFINQYENMKTIKNWKLFTENKEWYEDEVKELFIKYRYDINTLISELLEYEMENNVSLSFKFGDSTIIYSINNIEKDLLHKENKKLIKELIQETDINDIKIFTD